ncbi:MAG: tetratricopeptide repeat protein [Mycobacteriales bacterium]
MRRRTRIGLAALTAGALALALLLTGALAGSPGGTTDEASPGPAPAAGASGTLPSLIAGAQATLRKNPRDFAAWGNLGLLYVQQAKITVDPTYYPKAEGALKRSFALNTKDNYEAMAGEAALQSGLHNFEAARSYAKRGIAINGYESTLYGALGDALTQLGRYSEAAAAIQRMNDLKPGPPAFTRASYVFELRGDIPNARGALKRAYDDAVDPSDKAFAAYYLGELDFNYGGHYADALSVLQPELAQDPTNSTLLQGQARAEAAMGSTDQAVRDYSAVVAAVPQPQYVLELGELYQSLGRAKEADTQYSLFRTEEDLFRANGVTLDVEPTLFEADHGSPQKALEYAVAGWKVRPFLEMADAYGWALYRNHRYAEALQWSDRALRTGWTNNALFRYHRGMIQKELGHRAAARQDLHAALAGSPAFNLLQAPIARKALTSLTA